MFSTIYFDDQMAAEATEVSDVIPDGRLPDELDVVGSFGA
jgi:hypothetical protein